jgi:DNA-binding transcriptional MerR regulator
MMSTMGANEGLMSIGEVSAKLGLATSTLRYWEERGMVCPTERRSGRRLYGPEEVRRIALIQMWQEGGMMSLQEISELLSGRTPAGDWRDAVRGRLELIDEQIERLSAARAYLQHYLSCPREHPAHECPIVRDEVEKHIEVARP